jgi:hypothetical protein
MQGLHVSLLKHTILMDAKAASIQSDEITSIQQLLQAAGCSWPCVWRAACVCFLFMCCASCIIVFALDSWLHCVEK